MGKLRITPIGTCRIHTPLRRAAQRYPIDVDIRRNYGFVHTSDEALQQLRFLSGEKQFRPEVLPLVFRNGDDSQVSAQSWEASDLHLIEISSAKRLSCGPDLVQGNYVFRHFADFFASAQRSRQFWTLLRKGHRKDLFDFLRQQPSFQLMSKEDRDLLVNLSSEQQSFKAIKSDMAEMVERLGRDKVLFVTHINAAAADGDVLASRDRVIRWVKLAADQLGANVFDPTALMEEFGQERALEDSGLDLTHYTLAFSDRLYDAVHHDHVVPLFGSQMEVSDDSEAQQIAALAARLESTIEHGNFLAGARETHAAIDRHPDAAPLVQLRGLIRWQIGDFKGAVEDLGSLDVESLSQSTRISFVEALQATGAHGEALHVVQTLIRDEVESPRIYRSASESAEQIGDLELATSYAKQAFRMGRSDLSSALHALVLLTASGDELETSEWRHEILENIGSSSSGAFEVCLWAITNRDEELFAAALKAVAAADKAGAVDLMEDAFAAGMVRAMAASVPIAVALGRLPKELAERRAAVVQGALDRANQFAEEGQLKDSHQLASAVAALAGASNSQLPVSRLVGGARRLIRELVKETRLAAREAFSSQDMEEVIAIGAAAGDILIDDPESATLVARALYSVDRTEEGLALLKKVRAADQDSFMVHRWAARLAVVLRDYATALEMYGALRDCEDPRLAKVKPEMERFFETAERRVAAQLRSLVQSGKYDDALRVAELMESHFGASVLAERELNRMYRILRGSLKEIEDGEGDIEDRESILRRLVEIKPDDASMLRRLAVELMRQFRFAEAAEYWEQLHQLDPLNESADRNRVRCATLAERRSSASAQVVGAVG